MTKKISVLGSTGSIGVQTLDVARNLEIEVVGLTANSSIDLLEKQVAEFRPKCVSIYDVKLEDELKRRLKPFGTEVCSGIDGLNRVASIAEAETVVVSIVGIAGLIPTLEAIKHKKNVALANKETLVTAGCIVMDEARKNNVNVFPIDSEHSAIYQCLNGNKREDLKKIIITASGGPFRGKTKEQLQEVSLKDALKHPNLGDGQ